MSLNIQENKFKENQTSGGKLKDTCLRVILVLKIKFSSLWHKFVNSL